APICSPRPIEHFSEYPPRLFRTSPATEHVAEERPATWAPVHGDSLYFRDRLRPHLLPRVTLSGNQARSVQRWAERPEFFEVCERFVAAVVREKRVGNLGVGRRRERVELQSTTGFHKRFGRSLCHGV